MNYPYLYFQQHSSVVWLVLGGLIGIVPLILGLSFVRNTLRDARHILRTPAASAEMAQQHTYARSSIVAGISLAVFLANALVIYAVNVYIQFGSLLATHDLVYPIPSVVIAMLSALTFTWARIQQRRADTARGIAARARDDAYSRFLANRADDRHPTAP